MPRVRGLVLHRFPWPSCRLVAARTSAEPDSLAWDAASPAWNATAVQRSTSHGGFALVPRLLFPRNRPRVADGSVRQRRGCRQVRVRYCSAREGEAVPAALGGVAPLGPRAA